MKNIITLTALSLIFSVQSKDTFAQKLENSRPYFYGKVNQRDKGKVDSIVVAYHNQCTWGDQDRSRFVVKTDKNGSFNFRLAETKEYGRLYIATYFSNKTSRKPHAYFVEPSDSIRLDIELDLVSERDSFCFSGSNSEKYNLSERLMTLKEVSFRNDYRAIKLHHNLVVDTITLKAKLNQYLTLVNSYTLQVAAIMKSYGPAIKPEIQRLYKYELANYYGHWDNVMYNMNFSKNADIRRIVKSHYLGLINTLSFKSDKLMALSPTYYTFIAWREKQLLQFSKLDGSVELEDYYNSFKNKYSGELKDRLLYKFFEDSGRTVHGLSAFSPKLYDSLLNLAIKVIENPILKENLSNELKTSGKTPLIDADFTLKDGKVFMLSSLKGKVFLLDVWFLGCSGCAEFHTYFEKEIYPSFKHNENFVMLSINANQKKKDWLEGIESNLYTSDEYLNVTTNGLGFNHPFMKYYGIVGGPYVMLVGKDGKIYGRPLGTSPETLKTWINEALSFDHISNTL